MTTETTPEKARELAERLGRLRAPYRIHYVVDARDALLSLSDQVERLTGEQCSCGEVAGEDPDCTLHGRNTLWGKENPDMPMFADHLTALTKERDALREALTAMLGRYELYCGDGDMPAGEHDKAAMTLARAALNKEAK